MRLDNWQNNLSALIETKRETPFDFASHNCALWAFEAIKAVSGQDIAVDYLGKFKTETQAAKLIRKIDKVKTVQELLEKRLSQETKPIAFARMGDIVLASEALDELDLPGDALLFGAVPGLCNGPISYFVGEHGLLSIPTLRLSGALWVS